MKKYLLLLLIAASLLGCSAAGALPATATPSPNAAPADASGEAPTRYPADGPTTTPTTALTAAPVASPTAAPSPAASPTLAPTTTRGGSMPTNPIPQLVQQAQADLGAKLGVAPSSITLDRVEEREWPDSSLGCPEPGMMYSQVITPGWLIVLSVNGKTYEYHAGTGHVVTCQQ